MPPPAILIIGSGNPLQGDRSVGNRLVTHIHQWNQPHIQTRSVSRLTPELASSLATVDFVIFANAYWFSADLPYRVTRLEAYGSGLTGASVPGLGNLCDPATLLALTYSVHGRCPQAWWVEIAADDMRPSDRLSPITAQGMQQALEAIDDLVDSLSLTV